MTPEREAYFRIHAFRYDMEDLIAALDAARAERDELRAKVTALNVYLTKSHEWWSGASAKADGFRAAIIKGRELGLWEEYN